MDHTLSEVAADERVESLAEHRLITVIGFFKACKGALLLAAAFGTLSLLGKDLEDVVDHVVHVLRLAPDSKLVDWLYDQADVVTDGTLKKIASVGVVYGCLLCTEGYGLLRRRKWAEELTVIGTLLPVPFEIYELVQQPGLKRIGVLLLNLAIVAYLLKRRHEFTTHKQRKAAREAAKSPKPELAT